MALLAFLFLQLFCIGVNFSVLPSFGRSFGASDWMVGALYMAMTVPRGLFSPIWSSLSDRYGRRGLLLASASAQISGSVLWIASGSYGMLFLSRVVDGTFAAQGAISQSVAADISTPEKRAAAMGAIGAVISLSFTVGPLAGALVAASFGPQAVGWLLAGCQLASVAIAYVFLPETAPRTARSGRFRIPIFERAVRTRLFERPGTGLAFAGTFLVIAGCFHFTAAMPLSSEIFFGWTANQHGLGFALAGVVGAVVQGGLVRRLSGRVSEHALGMAGSVVAAAGFVLMGTGLLGFFWAGIAVASAGSALASPGLSALLSRCVGPGDQGAMMGLSQSVQTVARGGGPFLAGLAIEFSARATAVTAPLVLAGGIAFLWASRRAAQGLRRDG